MNLETVTLRQPSQTEKGISCKNPHMWTLERNDTTNLTKQKLTDLENEPMVAYTHCYI